MAPETEGPVSELAGPEQGAQVAQRAAGAEEPALPSGAAAEVTPGVMVSPAVGSRVRGDEPAEAESARIRRASRCGACAGSTDPS